MKKKIFLILLSFLMLTACSVRQPDEPVITDAPNVEKLDTELDGVEIYDSETAVQVFLDKEYDDDKVKTKNDKLIIKKEGTFVINGSLDDGKLVVNADADSVVTIVLNGITLNSSSGSPFKIKSAQKVILILEDNTTNTITSSFTSEGDEESNAAMAVHSELIIAGNGSLSVSSLSGNAIKSDSAIFIKNSDCSFSAAKHGIKAPMLYLTGTKINIEAQCDTIHVDSADTAFSQGITIIDTDLNLIAQDDGISCSDDISFANVELNITTGDGSASVILNSDRGDAPWYGTNKNKDSNSDLSQKGIKSKGSISISDCSFNIDSVNDCISTDKDLYVINGRFDCLRSGDDAIHAEGDIVIDSGYFLIPYCYEGIEGMTVTINDGSFIITSSDDGINAADENDESRNPFIGSDDNFVLINGGTFEIVSDGDCIDSNGDIIVNGGTLNLICNGNGNTAIDSSGDYINNGGDVTTNDGSEIDQHAAMGRPHGNHGGKRP